MYHFHSHVRLASNKNFEDRIVLSTILTVIWYLYYKTIWNATKNIYQIFKKYINNIFFFKKKVIKFMTDLILKHVFNFFLIILILKFKFNRSKKKINTKHLIEFHPHFLSFESGSKYFFNFHLTSFRLI